MINHLNQFKTGYGLNLSVLPQQRGDIWSVQFGKCSRRPGTLQNEAVFAAKRLAEQHRGPLDVFYSGGIDSEFMIHAFKEAAVDFNVLTIEFANKLNKHDLEYVEKFKKENPELKYKNVLIDVESFLQTHEAYDLAELTKCSLPHLLLLMKLSRESNAPIILGTGEPYLIKNDGNWFLRERESIASLNRFFEIHDLKGTHAFFQSTNELFYSYLNDPILQQVVSGVRFGKESSMSSRADLYSQYYPIEARMKYHGYEHMENLVGSLQKKLENIYIEYTNICYFPYEELMKSLEYRTS